jgi:polyisoprenoid-binding protein YceI
MNRIILGLAVAIGIAALSFSTALVNKTVDVSQSNVVWKAYKVTGAHEGTIKLKSGSLQLQDGKLTGGSFVVNMNTITCTDLTGGTADKLVGHLKSPDFFDVAKHPEATFVITQVVSRGTPGAYRVTGNISVKNITKPVRVTVDLGEEKGRTTATAAFKLDRSDFDVRFGSGSFFEDLGDKTIYDEFDLEVKLVTAQ